MSRIGKMPIALPAGVTVDFTNGVVTVKGPKGTLTREVVGNIGIESYNRNRCIAFSFQAFSDIITISHSTHKSTGIIFVYFIYKSRRL